MGRVLKVCAVGLSIVFFSLLQSGCGTQRQENAKPTITIWHWMTDKDPAFKELAQRYEAATGIKVDFELFAPSDAYSQKVRAAAQGGNLPDIFGILGEKRDFSSFIKAGHIFDLTATMQQNNGQWRNSFFPKALAVNEFSAENTYGVAPGIYGVPIDVTTIEMLYNKKLFKQLGFDPDKPPATLDEFLAMGKKIKAANMQGLVSGWGEVWMIDCFANNYAFNIMGKDKVLATIRGEVSYTDPDWIKVFSVFQEMRDSGVLAEGIISLVNKTAERAFAMEKAVFSFNGSWCVNVYKGMNPDLEYAAFLPPKATEAHSMSVWGGAGSSFMVNARSKNREEAVKFLQWLTQKDQQSFLAEATNNLPANKESAGSIPEILSQFAQAMTVATHPNTWGVTEFPSVIEAIDRGIQLIIIGDKTPEQVASDVAAIKQRELSKEKAP